MSDPKLMLNWSIDEAGLTVFLAPEALPDMDLGSLTIDEDLIMDDFRNDVQAFEAGTDLVSIEEWQAFADFLSNIAENIYAGYDMAKVRKVSKAVSAASFQRS
jgi:hypothetical protein